MHPGSHGDPHAESALRVVAELADLSGDLQARPHGTVRVVVLPRPMPENHQQPIPLGRGDAPVMAVHDSLDQIAVAAHQ